MAPLLEVIDLSHHFGGLAAISDFSLAVEAGELVGLIGPNGAGKTTVFNLITGVFRLARGRIFFQGADISAWASHRITAAGIARTFQNIRLFKNLSALDNVRLGAFARHRYHLFDALRRGRAFTEEERRLTRRAWELLERFQLSHYADTLARQLPYGEQRRLEMARALISGPRLLLLDEPAAGVPKGQSQALFRAIAGLPEEVSVLFVEHDMDIVFRFARRITVLVSGSILTEGAAEDIANDPMVKQVYLGNRR